jgi:hypothetical protein
VVSFTPLPLYPLVKKPPVPIGYEDGWTPEQVWTLWRREKVALLIPEFHVMGD